MTGRLPGPEETDDLVALAERAARAAGDLIRSGDAGRDARHSVASTKSSPTDVVTAMDRAVEEQLRRQLAEARPGDGALGEEAGLQPGAAGLTWVLDPIDGTVNYVYRIPYYAVSVAAVVGDPMTRGRWHTVAACVHEPVSGQTFTAGAGRGAARDGVPLTMAPPPPLAQALVSTGFGYQSRHRRSQGQVIAHLLPQIRDMRRFGSAALDLCMVAEGRVDAFYERGLNVWDLAAAQLVVTEAGGVVRSLDGLPGVERTLVAAAEPLAGRLAEVLLEAGADRGGEDWDLE